MKLTTKLLQDCADAAEHHFKLSDQITDAMIERYGVSHSDLDCDYLIEILDYGGGQIDLKECDRQMKLAGAKKNETTT